MPFCLILFYFVFFLFCSISMYAYVCERNIYATYLCGIFYVSLFLVFLVFISFLISIFKPIYFYIHKSFIQSFIQSFIHFISCIHSLIHSLEAFCPYVFVYLFVCWDFVFTLLLIFSFAFNCLRLRLIISCCCSVCCCFFPALRQQYHHHS